MPTFFAAWFAMTFLIAEPPPNEVPGLFDPVPAVEDDILGELVAQFEGIPVPVVDPFQNQVMVELRGTW